MSASDPQARFAEGQEVPGCIRGKGGVGDELRALPLRRSPKPTNREGREGRKAEDLASRMTLTPSSLPRNLSSHLGSVVDSEANLRNKINRGGFTGASLVQCLIATGCANLRLDLV